MPHQLCNASSRDLNALLQLEQACFTGDRLSKRSFQHFLQRPDGIQLLKVDHQLAGYAILLLHKGTALARLYSLAISPRFQGQGLGRVLMEAMIEKAKAAHRFALRLEVREDNQGAIQLYRQLGFRELGRLTEYYQDGSDGLKMELALNYPCALPGPTPFYAQQTDFSCGPAALMMAMHSLDPSIALNLSHELQLWREATSIFMTSGHGGCGPLGLALAARRRGFISQVQLNRQGPLFVDSVRSPAKKRILEQVHLDFKQQCQQQGIVINDQGFTPASIQAQLAQGWRCLMLINQVAFYKIRAPHWVWLLELDDHHAWISDPELDHEELRAEVDNQQLPIPRQSFDKMNGYGRKQLQALVWIRPDEQR